VPLVGALGALEAGIRSITVVFPAYNDAGTIASVVLAARRTVRRLTSDYEIVVVDDGSRDGTGAILGELKALLPELRLVRHEENRGYGAALKSGFRSATKELVFYTDSDAQFDPRELALLVRDLRPDVDYVSGYRTRRADPLLRVLVGNPYHRVIRAAFGLKLRDIDCDYRLFRRKVLERIELDENDGSMCIELLKKLEEGGFRFAETRVRHYPRVYGRSQYFTVRGVLASYLQMFRLWVRLVVRKNGYQLSAISDQ
jgi:glycosyltransferase involved in cell wall biosynthesis